MTKYFDIICKKKKRGDLLETEKKNTYNEKVNKWNQNYINTHKDRINFVMPKGYKEMIKTAAAAEKISASEFIRRAIEKELNCCGFDISENWKMKRGTRPDHGGADQSEG